MIDDLKLTIIGKGLKEKLNEGRCDVLLLRNTKNKQKLVVRSLSIDNPIFVNYRNLNPQITEEIKNGETILLNTLLQEKLGINVDDYVEVLIPEDNVFAYGTFLSAHYDFSSPSFPKLHIPGVRNNIFQGIQKTKAILKGFARLWPKGLEFPFIVPKSDSEVVGEIYFDISSSMLDELDRIEGVGYLYERDKVPVQLVEGEFSRAFIEAWVYIAHENLINNFPDAPEVDILFGDVFYKVDINEIKKFEFVRV